MVVLKPTAELELDDATHYVLASEGRPLSLLAPTMASLVHAPSGPVQPLRMARHPGHAILHPGGSMLARIHGGSGELVVRDITGKTLFTMAPPPIEGRSSLRRGFDDFRFEGDGRFLWAVAPMSENACQINLIETTGWTTVHSVGVDEPIGGSKFVLDDTPWPGLLSLWAAAGQDGQQVYWVARDHETNTILVETVAQLANCTPPVFSPDGEEFLVLAEFNELKRYAFPGVDVLGGPLESGDEDNPFAESMCYLDGRRAIVGTGEGRIFLVDVERMAVEDEVAVEGHEPRPIGEYYPNLADEKGLATDIAWFERVGEGVLFGYSREERGWLKRRRKDRVLWCPLPV
jgi:hypothetical protein